MSQKILLIEGDPQAREEFAGTLRQHQFQVSTATDGPTGVRIFEKVQPDLVISNLILGDMTAVEVCEKIRSSHGGQARIILVSNSKRSSKYIEGISQKYNLARFLQKPFSAEALLNVVVEALGKNGTAPGATDLSAQPGGAVKANRYLPGMLIQLGTTRATGFLQLKKEKNQKTIFFEKGEIVGVDSNVQAEQMGKLLVKKGVILEQDYLKAAQLILEEGIQMGEALLKLNCLEKPVLDDLIVEHQVTKVANAFLWIDAEITFTRLDKLPEVKNYGVISLGEVFKQGLTALRSTPNIGQVLLPIEDEFVGLTPDFERHRDLFAFGDDEKKLLEQVNTVYRLQELLASESQAALAALYLTGFLAPIAPKVDLLKKRLDELKSQSQGTNPETEAALAKARADLQKILPEKDTLAQQVATFTKERKKGEKRLQDLQEEIERLRQDNDQLKDNLKKSTKASQEREKWNAEKRSLQDENARLQKEMAEIRTQISHLEEQISRQEQKKEVADQKPLLDIEPLAAGAAPDFSPVPDFAAPPEVDFATELGELGSLESPGEAAPNPENTVVFQQGYQAELAEELTKDSAFVTGSEGKPLAYEPSADPVNIFDLAQELEGPAEPVRGEFGGAQSPDHTVVFAKPPVAAEVGSDGEIDAALQFIEPLAGENSLGGDEAKTSPTTPAASAQGNLPIDPFAPPDPATTPAPTEPPPPPAAAESADPFEDFFKIAE